MANDVVNNNEMTGSIDLKGSAAPSIPPGFCGKLGKKHSLPSPSSAEKMKRLKKMGDSSPEGTFKQMAQGTSDKSIKHGYLPSLSGTMDTNNDSKFNFKRNEPVLDTSRNGLKVDSKRWNGNEKQGTNKESKRSKVRSYADLFKRKAKESDRILETIETLPPKRGCNVIRPNCFDDVAEREDDSCVSNSKRQRVDLDPSRELHSYSSPRVVGAGLPMSRSSSKIPISLHDTRDKDHKVLEGEDDKYERGVGNHHGRELTGDYIIDGQNNESLIESQSDRDHAACVECLNGGEILKSSHHLKIESNANSSELMERLTRYIANERTLSSSRFVEYWVPVQISSMQLEQYCSTLLSNSMLLRSQSKNDSADHLEDVLISLRKCCDHPYLVDQSLQSFVTKGLPFSEHENAEINLSGKLQLLDKMLVEIKARGLSVVIIFQSLGGSGRYSVGDILDDFVHQRFGEDSYTRITAGSYVASKKQAALDMFNNKECGNFVLLIENRACLRSIKLVSVDTVILFDTDWEPRNDIKALEKMTIESQFEQLKVFRLYTLSTVEEKILILAKEGVTLDSNIWNINWSSFQSLLQWGASYLFEKLDEFHGSQSHAPIDEETFLKELLSEFSSQLPYNGKTSNPLNCSKISKVDQRREVYPTNTVLFGESHLMEENEPSVFFWTKLLGGRHPRWKLLSGSSQRTRRRVNFFDGFRKHESRSDHATVISEKMVNTVDPVSLQTNLEELAENHITGIAEGDNDKSKELIELHNAQTIIQCSLKPDISKLCHILQFPEGIKGMALRFLDFVVNEYNVFCDAASTLQAFQLSLCWAAALLSKHKIDHKQSFALAKLHLNFDCKETEARYIYSKLKKLKNVYAQHKRKSMCSKISPGARDLNPTKSVLGGQKGEKEKSPQRHEKLPENKQKVVQEFNTMSEKGREKLEEEHRLESALIRSRYSEISVRLDKLKESNHNFKTRVDEQNRQMDICCKNPKATQLLSGLKKVSHSEKHLADGKLFDNISTAIENSNATPKSLTFSEHHTSDKVSHDVLSVASEFCVDEVTISILDDTENHRTETAIYEEPLPNTGLQRKSEESHENCESILDSTEPCPETNVLTIQSAVQPSEVPQKLLTKVFVGDHPKEMGTSAMQLTTECEQKGSMTSDIAAIMEVPQEQDNVPPSQCSISPLHQMPLATSPPSLVNSRATTDTYMETQPNQNNVIMSSQQAYAPRQPVVENTSGLLRNPVMHHPVNFPMTSDRLTITEVPQEQDDVPPTCEESHTLLGFTSHCNRSPLHQVPLSISPPSLVNSRAIIHSYMETHTNQNNGIMSSQQAHAPRQPVIEDTSGLLRIPSMHPPANFPMQLSTDVLVDGSVQCVSDHRSSRIPQSMNDHSTPTRSDSLLNEMERILKDKEQIFKIHSETKSKLISDCSKEMKEIQKKYDTLLQDAETSLVQKTNELDTCYNKVRSNQLLGVLMNTYTKALGSSVARQAMPTSITNQHQLSTQEHNGNRRVVLSQSEANALMILPTVDSPIQVSSYSPTIISPASSEPHFRSILRLGEDQLARIGLRVPPPHLRPVGSPWPVSSSQIPHFPYGMINPHFPNGIINPRP